MRVYKNLAGSVGVCAYEVENETIRIKFHSQRTYLFNQKSTGKNHIEQMKLLANQGYGLYNYIQSNNVMDKYAVIFD